MLCAFSTRLDSTRVLELDWPLRTLRKVLIIHKDHYLRYFKPDPSTWGQCQRQEQTLQLRAVA